MTDAEIIALVRLLIKEPTVRRVSDADIRAAYLRGVVELGAIIKLDNPDYFAKMEIVQSYTNMFAWPSGCVSILGVWDYEGDAITVTACADNGAGIVRCTAASHGFSDNARIHVQGDWSGDHEITYVDENTFDVQGLTYVAATHTAAALRAWEYPDDMRNRKMTRIDASEATGSDDRKYYLRGRVVVVDNTDYDDDILLNYYYNPSALTDIPAEYHDSALVSYAVLRTIRVPEQTDPNYQDLLETKRKRQKMWDEEVPSMISGTLIPIMEAVNIDDTLEDSGKYIS